MEDQAASPILLVDPDSDVMSTYRYGGSNGDSEYDESTGNLPMSSAIKPDIAGHTRKLEMMYEVLVEEINSIVVSTVLFTHTNQIKITELADAKTDPTKNHQDNGTMPPLGTQPSSPH